MLQPMMIGAEWSRETIVWLLPERAKSYPDMRRFDVASNSIRAYAAWLLA
jgi:hypothetical protein